MMLELVLKRVKRLCESTRELRFETCSGKSLDYEPGQFYRFSFEDNEGLFQRSYSLGNLDDLYGPYLDIVISKVDGGRATKLLFNAEPGLKASVTGPHGRLVLPADKPRHLILVATSVGVAPYLPILQKLENEAYERVDLYFGVRNREEFIYKEFLTKYAEDHGFFNLKLCISREDAKEEYEHRGYVTDLLKKEDPSPAGTIFLVCGNPKMVEDVWSFLTSKKFGGPQVITEKYVFARDKTVASTKLTEAQKKLIEEELQKFS